MAVWEAAVSVLLPAGCQGAGEVLAAMWPRPGCWCRPGTSGSGSPQTLSLRQRPAVPGVREPVPKSVPGRRAEDASPRGRAGRGVPSLHPSKGYVSPVPWQTAVMVVPVLHRLGQAQPC